MGEQGKPNGVLAERQIWQLEAQLMRLQGLFDWYQHGIDKDLMRLEKGIRANADEIDDLKKSINSAIPMAGDWRRRHRLRAAAQRRDVLRRAELLELTAIAFAGLVVGWVAFGWVSLVAG